MHPHARMSQMIFAAFDREGRARAAVDRLRGESFEPGGISLLARQDLRDQGQASVNEGPDRSTLDPLLDAMTTAPDLEVDGHEVAASGALPNLLKPAPGAGLGGLEKALTAAGIEEKTAAAFEQTVRDRGLVLGIAAENAERGRTALGLLENEGALALAALEIPEQRRDR